MKGYVIIQSGYEDWELEPTVYLDKNEAIKWLLVRVHKQNIEQQELINDGSCTATLFIKDSNEENLFRNRFESIYLLTFEIK